MCDFGPRWVPLWLHFGPLLGAQDGSKIASKINKNSSCYKMPSKITPRQPRSAQERPETLPSTPRTPPGPPPGPPRTDLECQRWPIRFSSLRAPCSKSLKTWFQKDTKMTPNHSKTALNRFGPLFKRAKQVSKPASRQANGQTRCS